MQTDIKIIISAVDKGFKKTAAAMKEGFAKSAKSVKVFNEAVGSGKKAMSGLAGEIRMLVGAWAGIQGLSGAVGILQDADAAMFNMRASVRAANREFKNTGGLEYWEGAVRRLSDQMRVYTDTELRNAISRTVDMTKRLGLTKEQMEEVIRRSADLGAGKVDLEGAIERVTAALRGEAESAEYLGLTLNENYVKAWAKAHKVTKKAWKDLSDLEKAQVRYQAFLAQSAQFQGRAADSARTFSGAIKLVRKELENAITRNQGVKESFTGLAQVLRDNAGEIGSFVAKMVELAGRILEFAAKYRNAIGVVLASAAAWAVLAKATAYVKGLNAALAVLTGKGIIAFFGQSLPVALSTTAGAVATLAGAFAALFVGWKLGRMINDMRVFKDLSATVGDAVQYTFANIDKFFTNLRIKWLEIKRMMAEAATLGHADTSGIQREIEAEKQHIRVIEITKRRLEEKAAGARKAASQSAAAAQKEKTDYMAVVKAMDEADRKKRDLAETPAVVPVTADTKQFREEIVQLEDGTYTNVFIPVDGDTAPAKKRIAELSKSAPKVKLPVSADTRPASVEIKKLRAAAAGMDISPRVKVDVNPALSAIGRIRAALKAIPDETVYVNVVRRSAKRLGGMVSALAAGGRLPGYGGGDRIRALLEAGEYVIRKEAVRKYGAALFNALNRMAIDPPDLMALLSGRRFAAGGLVPSESMTISFRAGGVEMPLTVAGPPSVTRQMVKEFEAELRKMGLSHA